MDLQNDKLYKAMLADKEELEEALRELEITIKGIEKYAQRVKDKGQKTAEIQRITNDKFVAQNIFMSDSIKLVTELLQKHGSIKTGGEIWEMVKQKGYNIDKRKLSSYMSQNSAKKYFYFDKELEHWCLAKSQLKLVNEKSIYN